MKKSLINLDNQ